MCGGAIPGKWLRRRPGWDSLSVDHQRRILDSLAGHGAKRERKGGVGPSGGIEGGGDRCHAIEELCEDGSHVSRRVRSKNILRPLLRQPRLEAGVVIDPETSRSRRKDSIHLRQTRLVCRG